MNLTYGYCRISTKQQNLERQERNILDKYKDAIIYKEAYTGTTTDRPVFNKLLEKVRAGDTIVFDSVSRMSRDAKEGAEKYFKLYEQGINLVFLNEPYINTETYDKALHGKHIELTGDKVDIILKAVEQYLQELLKEQIYIAFGQAQKEHDDLVERTKGGIETARRNGKQIGQPKGKKLITKKSIDAKKDILKHCKDFGGSLNDKETMKYTHLARNTYYKYKRELKEEMLIS